MGHTIDPMREGGLLRLSELAEITGDSAATVRNRAKAHKITVVKLGRDGYLNATAYVKAIYRAAPTVRDALQVRVDAALRP